MPILNKPAKVWRRLVKCDGCGREVVIDNLGDIFDLTKGYKHWHIFDLDGMEGGKCLCYDCSKGALRFWYEQRERAAKQEEQPTLFAPEEPWDEVKQALEGMTDAVEHTLSGSWEHKSVLDKDYDDIPF